MYGNFFPMSSAFWKIVKGWVIKCYRLAPSLAQ